MSKASQEEMGCGLKSFEAVAFSALVNVNKTARVLFGYSSRSRLKPTLKEFLSFEAIRQPI
jgi:hypothetical protein